MKKIIAIAVLMMSTSAFADYWPNYPDIHLPDVNTNTTNHDDSVNVIDDHDYSASSAAPLMLNSCQSGMSVQVKAGGIASAGTESFCRLIDLSNHHDQAMHQSRNKAERAEHHKMKHYYLDKASKLALDTAKYETVEERATSAAKTSLSIGAIVWLLLLI